MAEPKKCFVIMPFGEEGTEEHERNWKIYFQIIKPVVEACGYLVKRADELEYLGNISRDIIEWLYDSQLVIADLSGKNANVFYELGVRHTLLRAGTIPIIRKGEKPPFDIANYRTIFYSIELDGSAKLQQKLKARIEGFESLQEDRCDNPVHETLGTKIPQGDVMQKQAVNIKALQTEIEKFKSIHTQNQELIRQAEQWSQEKVSYEQEIAALHQNLSRLNQEHQQLNEARSQLKLLAQQAEHWSREKAGYEHKIGELQIQLQKLTPPAKPAKPPVVKPAQLIKPRFRSEPKTLSEDEVQKMLEDNDFFDKSKNQKGRGFENQFEEKKLKGTKVIFDQASSLMWQQGGSEKYMSFQDAEAFIQKLNTERFAGFTDWRLPTLEEAMSLMEPKKNQSGLYIDEHFDAKQQWIWTADSFTGGSERWYVYFDSGDCYWDQFDSHSFVRGVRFGQSSDGD